MKIQFYYYYKQYIIKIQIQIFIKIQLIQETKFSILK